MSWADLATVQSNRRGTMTTTDEQTTTGDSDALITLADQHTGHSRWGYLFAAHRADDHMFVPELGWFAWSGTHWQTDRNGARATQSVLSLLREGRDAYPDLDKEIGRMEQANGLRGILAVAQTIPEMIVAVDDLDAEPNLFNTPAGTLDLTTCEVGPHDRRHRITKLSRGSYRPGESARVWDDFLSTSLPDEEIRGFLQRYIGYAMSGRVSEHVLPILTGTGRNGKGVFYESLTFAFGSYAGIPSPDLFMERKGQHKTTEMTLRGLRLASVSETENGAELAVATMKRLTGGDRITARLMHRDDVTFTPSHSSLFITNHLPKIKGEDPAVWARVRVVPFDVVFDDDQQDRDLPAKLELVADALLTWAVDGRRDYLKRGLAAPERVKAETQAYRHQEDAITQFLERYFDRVDGTSEPFAHTWGKFQKFLSDNSYPTMKRKEFRAGVESRGFTVETDARSNSTVIRGLTATTPTIHIAATR